MIIWWKTGKLVQYKSKQLKKVVQLEYKNSINIPSLKRMGIILFNVIRQSTNLYSYWIRFNYLSKIIKQPKLKSFLNINKNTIKIWLST